MRVRTTQLGLHWAKQSQMVPKVQQESSRKLGVGQQQRITEEALRKCDYHSLVPRTLTAIDTSEVDGSQAIKLHTKTRNMGQKNRLGGQREEEMCLCVGGSKRKLFAEEHGHVLARNEAAQKAGHHILEAI